jgi:uncharacterized protein YndB with AHSA1/START domain
MSSAPITRTVEVAASQQRAFELFTDGMAGWWPREYTWAGDVLELIAIEPRAGGRCFERGPHGFSCDWGRVLVWEPPRRLVFTWQISAERTPEPDPAKAGEVEVRFVASGTDTTRVELEHRGFERHGEAGAGYRAAMDSEYGWARILARFAAAAG